MSSLRRFFALLLVFVLVGNTAFAQQRVPAPGQLLRLSPEDKDRGLNGVQKNFYFSTGSTSDDYQNAGFFGQKLRPYLASNKEALSYLNAYRRQKWLFLSERVVFLGAAGLYGQQILAADEKQYFNTTQKVALGVAAFSLLSNALISRNTNTHMQRAVETYNGMLPAARRGTLQRLRPTTIGLAAASTGRPLLALQWTLR